MSVFSKMKQLVSGTASGVKKFFSINGVKLELQVPDKVSRASGMLTGKLRISTKSEQYIRKVEVKLVEKWATGSGEDLQEKDFQLGKITLIETPFVIKDGESKIYDFSIAFIAPRSRLGEMDSLGSETSTQEVIEKSEYYIQAIADVKGVVLDPLRKVNITLVD